MLGSYGLLGIFVYCEHKAGPSPTHTFTLGPCASLCGSCGKSMVTYIQTDRQTDRPGEPGGGVGGVLVVVWCAGE